MTSFKLQEKINNLTNNTKFARELIKNRKTAIENNFAEYILQTDDFSEADQDILAYLKSELGLTNNNWGYLKYDGSYERKGAYCFRVYNKDNQFVFEVGSNRDTENEIYQSCLIPFGVEFIDSKVKKGAKKASYNLNGKPVKVTPFFGTDGKPGVFNLTVSLGEIDLELPLYIDKEIVKDEKTFWEFWEKGEAHLIAQVPKKNIFASAGKFLQTCILANEFPKNGVACLLTSPTLRHFETKESKDEFAVCEFEVLAFSHPDIKCQTDYVKDGENVSLVYDTKDITKLSFALSHKACKEWVSAGGEPNILMIVWFKELNKRTKTYIPNHMAYILNGEEEDIPPMFIDLFDEFLENIDEVVVKTLPQIQAANSQYWINQMNEQSEMEEIKTNTKQLVEALN